MKNLKNLLILLLFFFISGVINAQVEMNFTFDTPYGNNESVGNYVELNGAQIYYEEYGEGEPLLLIHGNSGNINSMGNQIDFFKTKYRVIIADSRGQGKSELKTDSLTYKQIAKDWEGLVNHLKLDSLNIIGWSDGGIVGLKMAISNESKIKKLVAMGANLRPDTLAVKPYAVNHVSEEKERFISNIKKQDTRANWDLWKQVYGLMVDQPNIPIRDLSKIKAKVLVIAGDEDVINNRHTVDIYENISNAQLCIMPGETHWAPASNPELFNEIVAKFLSEPFKRPNSDFTKW